MERRRDVRDYMLRMDEYGMSGDRYRELMYMCRQYDAMRSKLDRIRMGADDPAPSRGNSAARVKDPTGNNAARAADSWCARRIRDIEQAANAADPSLSKYILSNVTRGVRFEEMPVPCGINQFYRARRRFFWELDQRAQNW